jgi:Concanavalin A-like lectin/glucanases superfamily/Secretion system C-terminal sorting domain
MPHLFRSLFLSGALAATSLLAHPAAAQHALRFTSADFDRATFATTALNSGSFTYEIWVNYSAPQVLSSFTTLFEYGNDNRALFLGTDGLLSTYGSSNTLYSNGPLPLQSWHHVAFTYDENTTQATIYIDGLPSGTGLMSFPTTTENELGIGAHSSDAGWQGELDEVVVWQSVRTPAQIQTDMHGAVPVTDPNLIAYFKFDASTGQTCVNQKAGGPTGVLGESTAVEQEDPVWTSNNAPLAVPAERAAEQFGLNLSPNPAAAVVRITYSLPTAAPVSLTLLDITGRTIATLTQATSQPAGDHTAVWPVAGLPAGMYTFRLQAGTTTAVRRLVVVD